MSGRQKSDLEVCYAATVATDLAEKPQSVAKVAGVATVAGGGFEFSNGVLASDDVRSEGGEGCS